MLTLGTHLRKYFHPPDVRVACANIEGAMLRKYLESGNSLEGAMLRKYLESGNSLLGSSANSNTLGELILARRRLFGDFVDYQA